MELRNEHISEKFTRSRVPARSGDEAVVWVQPPRLNEKIRDYFEAAKAPVKGGSWLDCPEVPTSEEVLDIVTEGTSDSVVEIVPNRPKGAWESKEAYLSCHYELMREDAVRPLREAVGRVRLTPAASEEAFSGAVGIYEKVHICAVTPSLKGIAVRVTFSTKRAGKSILWDQSKRLISGGLVVLTPADDMFKSTGIVATVAARPAFGLEKNPPEIDLYFARAEELEIDPAKEWVMVEDRSSFFEADRHTLLALQKMMREKSPLTEHLINPETRISPPEYVKERPLADMRDVFQDSKHQTYENVNMLKGWPSQPRSDMDSSQLAALHRILTKRLAIVQGPPGTGKTFVSEQAIKVMIKNRQRDDPPIIIACQTNHAVDQLLRHIATFDPEFIRLGGRSKDKEVIKPRTLYEVKGSVREPRIAGSLDNMAKKKMTALTEDIGRLLQPLAPITTPGVSGLLEVKVLEDLKLLTAQQASSLIDGANEWVQTSLTSPNEAKSPFTVWLDRRLLRTVPVRPLPESFGFEYEEVDLEFEQLKEAEAEAGADEDFETLSGLPIILADNFTCAKGPGMTDSKIKEALKQSDMWKINEGARAAIYRYLQTEMKKRLLIDFRAKAKEFDIQAARRRTGKWEYDELYLKKAKIIGMTTTGLSKYRGLISALQPKIVLIEEAAETLEAPVAVACFPTLQHLILVGDHKQLRPHCHVKAHEDHPYYFNISLFERWVDNNDEYSTLSLQRRMIPEVRRVLYPIYGKLIKDHPSVLDKNRRPDVPGMGGVNSFFFTHQWYEKRDEHMSAYNPDEADMIVGFVEHLVYNGVDTKDITVLTFYNGQRKRILKGLLGKASLNNGQFNVVTVDSYQGEENKIVLLSLVRSNDKGNIGFLSVDNRVCVALSRAQCGFYVFGNAQMLHDYYKDARKGEKTTWRDVIRIMFGASRRDETPIAEPRRRLDAMLPVRCKNHNNLENITSLNDFNGLHGGCSIPCKARLTCGHTCELNCHPFSHDLLSCHQLCGRPLPCGHGLCEESCASICVCKKCVKPRRSPKQTTPPRTSAFDGKEMLAPRSTPEAWKSFASEELIRHSAPASTKTSPAKSLEADLLGLQLQESSPFGGDGAGDVMPGHGRQVSETEVEVILKDGRKKWKVRSELLPAAPVVVSAHEKEENLIDL